MGSPSRLRGGNQAKKACSFKVTVFGSYVGPGSAKTDSFLCPPPTATSGVVAGTGTTQAGSPVVSAPGVVPVSFLPEPDDVKIDEGTLLPVRCRVSGFAGPRSSLRCWSEHDLQGEQKRVGQRNAFSLRHWLETDHREHNLVFTVLLIGSGWAFFCVFYTLFGVC